MSDIKDFVIKDGVLLKYMGTDEHVIIPKGVIKIGSFAFCGALLDEYECRTIIERVFIPDGVKEIGYKAFNGCINLRSISIPASMALIELGAFENCTNLQEILLG